VDFRGQSDYVHVLVVEVDHDAVMLSDLDD